MTPNGKGTALVIGLGAPKGKTMDNDEMDENELCIPAAALAANDGSNQVPPSEGDTVDFQASGKVTKVEGDNVYVKVEKANDQDIEGSDKEEASESPDEEKAEEDKEGQSIRGAAQKEDDMGY